MHSKKRDCQYVKLYTITVPILYVDLFGRWFICTHCTAPEATCQCSLYILFLLNIAMFVFIAGFLIMIQQERVCHLIQCAFKFRAEECQGLSETR